MAVAVSASPAPTSVESEFEALKKIRNYAILILVGSVLGIVFSVLAWTSSFTAAYTAALEGQTGATQTATLQPLSGFLKVSAAASVVGAAVDFASILYLRSGFKRLVAIGGGEFSVCATLLILYLVGTAIIVPVLVGFYWTVLGMVGTSATLSGPPSLGWLLLLFSFLGAAAVGGILVLIGAIGGVILGLWRVGTRYSSDLFKVASILSIIPFLSIVGSILILVGAGDARTKLSL